MDLILLIKQNFQGLILKKKLKFLDPFSEDKILNSYVQLISVIYCDQLIFLVVDDTELDKLSDPKLESYMRNLVIPKGIEIIREKIKIKSEGFIPPFNEINCRDPNRFGVPNIKIRTDYHKSGVDADFLLYIGIVNSPENFLAHATFCVQGNIMIE